MLSIKNLSVRIEGRSVINNLDMQVGVGEAHVVMGANGSGKSSLAQVLMGDTRFKVQGSSNVRFERKDLLTMTADERSRAGLFVAWQAPVSIPGVSVFSLCKASYTAMGRQIDTLVAFKKELEHLAVQVGLTKEHIERNVNEGFSGGERKRLELLQLLLLKPKLVILDEIDSGLDARGVKLVVKLVNEMKQQGTSFILITHNKRLLEEVMVDTTWEMHEGQLSARI